MFPIHVTLFLFISDGTLGFYLNGVAYPNGSTVLRTDIGEDANALQCTTDSTTCCRNGIGGEIRAGDFHFPVSDATVPTMGLATDGYYRDRDSRLIRLHRQSTGTLTGRFRCNIPQASGPPYANLYINIGEESNISACIQHVCSYMYNVFNLYFQSIYS